MAGVTALACVFAPATTVKVTKRFSMRKDRSVLKSVEEKVLDLLLDVFPTPVEVAYIEKRTRQNNAAVLAVLIFLLEKEVIVISGGRVSLKNPPKYRSIDSGWEP
jgi:hypothetical protein